MTYRNLKPLFALFLTTVMGLSGCGGGGGGGGGGIGGGHGSVDLLSIELTPGSQSLPKGVTQQYVATGIYSDSSTQDLSTQVSWDTSDHALASIDNTGLVTALGVGGPVTVTATLGAVTGNTALTVTSATLSAIGVTPASRSLARGLTQQYTATGTYSDGSTLDITSQVNWDTSNHTVATINAAGLASALNAGGPISVSATLGAISNSAALTVTSATLGSIDVTPTALTLPKGVKQQYTATGHYSDGSTSNLTATATWASSDATVASIDNAAGSKGLASALKTGTTTISATFASVVGSTSLNVTAETLQSIQVTPTSVSLAINVQQAYTATGTYSDGSTQNITTQVTWSSSNTAVAIISNAAGSKGQATAKTAGTTTLTATSGAISGNTSLTVSPATLSTISVSAASGTVGIGLTQQYTATGTYSDSSTQNLTTQVTWSSSNTAVASISNAAGSQGVASTIAAGTTSVIAKLGSVTGSTPLTVTAATLQSIEVNVGSDTLAVSFKQTYTATGLYSDGTTLDLSTQVTWTSSDATVASISNAAGSKGLASALKVGVTTIGAQLGAIAGSRSLSVSSSTLQTIQVTAASQRLPVNTQQAYTATGVYSDGSTLNLTTQVTWSSSNTAFAIVSNSAGSKGLVTAKGAGSANIVATLGAITGSTSLTVTNATLSTIGVTPASRSLVKGLTQQYAATGTYSDGSTLDITHQVNWDTSNHTVATINAAGLASALNAGGPISVSATLGAISNSASLTVTSASLNSIDVTPTSLTLPKGVKQQYTAIGHYSDGSTSDLTATAIWASLDATVASIDNAAGSKGLATALKAGTTTISATVASVVGNTSLNVNAETLQSIQVTPTSLSLAINVQQAYTATGTYSDGSTQDVTTQVTWSSSNAAVATISNAAGSQGLATAKAAGTTTLTATAGAISGNTALTVSPATLSTIEVSADSTSLPTNLSQQYTATGVYSDGSKSDLTSQVTWASSASAVASISNADGSRGLATTFAAGSTTISATFAGITGSSTLEVTAKTLQSIEVTAYSNSLAAGFSQVYTATGVYSDGTTLDLSTLVTWTSSDTNAASVSNAPGSQGLVNALAAGSSTIAAAYGPGSGTISGSLLLTVSSATLTSIDVTSPSDTLFQGLRQQYTAIGTFSDGSTEDLTNAATWAVSDDSSGGTPVVIASISNAAGSQGLLTALTGGGPVDVSATIGVGLAAITGSTPLDVNTATLSSLALTPTNRSVPKGLKLQYSVTGTYSDGTTLDLTTQVTWSSSNTTVASISNAAGTQGLATTLLAGGPIAITARLGNLGSVNTSLTVTNAILSSISITPANLTLPQQLQQQYTATATFSDATLLDITNQSTWASSNRAVAAISNSKKTKGLANTLATGAVNITATLSTLSPTPGTTTLTVNNLVLSSLAVTPPSTTCGRSRTKQFTATATYTDTTTQNLTMQVNWTSSNNKLVTIGLHTGLAKTSQNPNRTGTASVFAKLGGKTASATVTKISAKTACTP